jgi:hypothetical protein
MDGDLVLTLLVAVVVGLAVKLYNIEQPRQANPDDDWF